MSEDLTLWQRILRWATFAIVSFVMFAIPLGWCFRIIAQRKAPIDEKLTICLAALLVVVFIAKLIGIRSRRRQRCLADIAAGGLSTTYAAVAASTAATRAAKQIDPKNIAHHWKYCNHCRVGLLFAAHAETAAAMVVMER